MGNFESSSGWVSSVQGLLEVPVENGHWAAMMLGLAMVLRGVFPRESKHRLELWKAILDHRERRWRNVYMRNVLTGRAQCLHQSDEGEGDAASGADLSDSPPPGDGE